MTHRPPFPPDYEPFDSAWETQNAAQMRADRLNSAMSFLRLILVLLVLAGAGMVLGAVVGASAAHHDTKPAWAHERVNR